MRKNFFTAVICIMMLVLSSCSTESQDNKNATDTITATVTESPEITDKENPPVSDDTADKNNTTDTTDDNTTDGDDSQKLPVSNRSLIPLTDYIAEQTLADEMLLTESKLGYTFDEPQIIVNPYGTAPLSAVVIFTTDDSIGGTVTVKGKSAVDDVTGTFKAEKEHIVPVYGLYPDTENDVILTLENGESVNLKIQTDSIPIQVSNINAEMYNESSYDYSTLSFAAITKGYSISGFDSKGDVRWFYSDNGCMGITLLDNGHIMIPTNTSIGSEFPNGRTGIREIDFMGKTYNEYVWNGGQHHDQIQLDNGNFMAVSSTPGLSCNRDYVTEVDGRTGEVVWELPISDIIDPSDGGSLLQNPKDWCHNNSLFFDEANDTLYISCRHLDSVLAVKKSTKQLKYIIGNPSGWNIDSKYFLTPVGDEFEWQYGQHQLTLLSNGDLLLFDNGNSGRVKAPDADKALQADQNYSRAVIYRIDESNMTIEQIWQYGKERGVKLYCPSQSGVQLLDEATRYMTLCFGTATWNESAPEPQKGGSYSYIDIIKDNELIWELSYEGVSTYRTIRLALYNDGEGFNVGRKGQTLGDYSVTATVDKSFDLTNAKSMPAGPQITYKPYAIVLSGDYSIPSDSEAKEDYLILAGADNKQLVYPISETKTNADDKLKITLNKPISVKGIPEGQFDIYIMLNDEIYDTGLYFEK